MVDGAGLAGRDLRIERDAAAGTLDRLAKQALASHAAGKSRLL
jgi:hypothetical protein